MLHRHRIPKLLRIALAAALLAPAASMAQDFADSDMREIASYVLTESGLARFTRATRNLGAIAKQSSDDCDDDESAQSLDAAAAKFGAIPGVRPALEAAGMTAREYLLFSWSVFQNGMAAWALDQPGGQLPPGVSMANVNFYRAHEAELQKLAVHSQSGDCDDAGDAADEVQDE